MWILIRILPAIRITRGLFVANARWARMNLSQMNSESSEDDSDDKGRRNVKQMKMSRSSLGKYDVKKKKIMPEFDEEEPEEDFLQQVEWIRREVNQRKLLADAVETTEEEVSILSNKRQGFFSQSQNWDRKKCCFPLLELQLAEPVNGCCQ